ncbi:flagellar hook-basal body complex protein FliE [Janthinobacterium fluminis]|uniref:Flagellar hook-basal body complex protein FliE n=1 Tax=Janthinobacterium fluminis TaxID=2987524 RepID=A0ABT5K2V7_9BURK|nr:flagellar hook-basal body complex protein FliE [Janthinobacterium fluminis]MDC8759305.1 flagellar hook-basal body complex protein FliE [Janthinobacterium fluminis]
MKTGGIDSSRIEAMIAQLKAAATRPQERIAVLPGAQAVKAEAPAAKVNFSDALKGAIDSVNGSVHKSEEMGKKFAMGDDSVALSDVMIAMQKASINFQASIQVRNKLVASYHEIMNMQV